MRIPLLLAFLLVVAGCTAGGDGPAGTTPPNATPPSTTTPTASSADRVAWVEKLCAVDDAVVEVSGMVHRSRREWAEAPEAHRAEIVAFLNEVDTALRGVLEQVVALKPTPFANGDAMVESYRGALQPVRDKIAQYASEAATFPADGLEAVHRLALAELGTFSIDRTALDGDPLYAEARESATGCGNR